jgi:Signal transduction histidine kinase
VPLRSWANLKNIKITVQAAPQINARVDENMFKTIVRNLISNAIKYSEPGNDICVTLTPNDDEIVITVADQGRGINAELLSSLFQNKEEVLDRSLAENKIGLGLVLCSDFTIRHNGRIWAESEIGKGTKISFTIPLRVNIEC